MLKSFKTLREDFIENRWRVAIGSSPCSSWMSSNCSSRGWSNMPSMISRWERHPFAPSPLRIEVLVLALGIGGFRYVWRYLLLGAARRMERALRDRFFLHLQTSRFRISPRRGGRPHGHATNDIEAVRMSISLGLVFIVDTIILAC